MKAWDHPDFAVASDSAWLAPRRRLQGWYREHVLGLGPGLDGKGVVRTSMLRHEDVLADPSLNFLRDSEILAVVERRLLDPSGTIEVDRLRRNLLSSMPLCFNLFGKLGSDPVEFAAVLRSLGLDVAEVTGTRVEWAPDPKSEFLADNTAFDAFVEYLDAEGRSCFLGIETKYTEPFSQKSYLTARYQEVTADSVNGFRSGAAEVLKAPVSNQLWRNLMLAMSTRAHPGNRFERGRVVVVSLAADQGAAKALDAVEGQLLHPDDWLSFLPIERIVEVAASRATFSEWGSEFTRRYLDLMPVS